MLGTTPVDHDDHYDEDLTMLDHYDQDQTMLDHFDQDQTTADSVTTQTPDDKSDKGK